MKVQALARAEGVKSDTIRHYVRIGLLNPEKDDSGYHCFGAAERHRLRFIRQARDLGFTLNDIRTMLQEAEKGQSPCPTVRALIEPRLKEARQRLHAMQDMVERMEAAVARWADRPDCYPCGEHICLLIEGSTEPFSCGEEDDKHE